VLTFSAPSRAGAPPGQGWIESSTFDLALLTLPLLAGIPLSLLLAHMPAFQNLAVAAIFLGLGLPHYVSSYAFYLDSTNRSYYRTRRAAFYLGPVLVVALLVLSLLAHLAWLVAAAVVLWNVYHVARQNHGILSLYRRLAGGDARREGGVANLALLGLAAGMFAVLGRRDPNVQRLLAFVPPALLEISPWGLLLAGTIALMLLGTRMGARQAAPGAAEWAFLACAVALFAPYLLVSDPVVANMAMLTGHYVQYLALVWLLNRRRYAGPAPAANPWLVEISRHGTKLALALGCVVAAGTVFHFVTEERSRALNTLIFNAVVLLHFYVDGLCWALRHREIRDAIGPFLLLPSRYRRLAA
jgi:hypothetical protein